MKQWKKRILSLALSLLTVLALIPAPSSAALSGVYFTAVNEQLLDLSYDTMPFWSGNTLYISSRFFEQSDLEVRYVRNASLGLAVLYTAKTDLRFDLEAMTATDKSGRVYTTPAIEKAGVVFFPMNLVCSYFGLTASYLETDTVPLIRLTNLSAVLSDKDFVDAASAMMAERYADYESWWKTRQPIQTDPRPPVQASEGQKIFLLLESMSAEDTRRAMELLEGHQATFLLPQEQLEDGDLVRALVCAGHGVALLARSESEEQLREEILAARDLVWKNSCTWLNLVWSEEELDLTRLMDELGCVRVGADVTGGRKGLTSSKQVDALLGTIGGYRDDLPVLLDSASRYLAGLGELVEKLDRAQYRICAWRLAG